MKKLLLFSVILSNTAQAQWLADNQENMSSLKAERLEMEVDTNQTVLEKVEEFRLQDEIKRGEDFESLNFSVYGNSTVPDEEF